MITTTHFKTLDDLYDYYNKMLFSSKLPECILNMSRMANTVGFFAPERWKGSEEEKKVHEISLTPEGLAQPAKEWHATLVHEMCHLWQQEFGKPSRAGYHNHEWAAKMEAVGLMPSSTGMPGGKKVGQGIADYPIEGGLFEEAFNMLDEVDLENFRLKYLPALTGQRVVVIEGGEEDPETDQEGEKEKEEPSRSGRRQKYICSCGNKVWGKSGLQLTCKDCNSDYIEQ